MKIDDWSERKSGWTCSSDRDARTPWDVDYGRVVHSASFRILQGKTQILSLGDGDFYRNRLTHSIEVSQVACGIVRQLSRYETEEATQILPSMSLMQAISSAHDLGHPPFGHGGEVALNECMATSGGFEGNGQTLRILTKLEKFSDRDGADLCRRTLLGVLKYPASYSDMVEKDSSLCISSSKGKLRVPPKCFLDEEKDVVRWILDPVSKREREEFVKVDRSSKAKTIYKSLDCAIMELADDISYGIHDLEDSIETGLLSEHDFRSCIDLCFLEDFLSSGKVSGSDSFFSGIFGSETERKRMVGKLVGYMIQSVAYKEVFGFSEPLLRWSVVLGAPQKELLCKLKNVVKEKVIGSANVRQLEHKGKKMVVEVFDAFANDPDNLLPHEKGKLYKEQGLRAICDFIAGMTDAYLMRTYDRLFSPRMGSIFDRV